MWAALGLYCPFSDVLKEILFSNSLLGYVGQRESLMINHCGTLFSTSAVLDRGKPSQFLDYGGAYFVANGIKIPVSSLLHLLAWQREFCDTVFSTSAVLDRGKPSQFFDYGGASYYVANRMIIPVSSLLHSLDPYLSCERPLHTRLEYVKRKVIQRTYFLQANGIEFQTPLFDDGGAAHKPKGIEVQTPLFDDGGAAHKQQKRYKVKREALYGNIYYQDGGGTFHNRQKRNKFKKEALYKKICYQDGGGTFHNQLKRGKFKREYYQMVDFVRMLSEYDQMIGFVRMLSKEFNDTVNGNQRADSDGTHMSSSLSNQIGDAPLIIDMDDGGVATDASPSRRTEQSHTESRANHPPAGRQTGDDEHDNGRGNRDPERQRGDDEHDNGNDNDYLRENIVLGVEILSAAVGAVFTRNDKDAKAAKDIYLWYILIACILVAFISFLYHLFFSKHGNVSGFALVMRAIAIFAACYAFVTAIGLLPPYRPLMFWVTLGAYVICLPAIIGYLLKK